MCQAAVSAEPDLDVGRVRSPERGRSAGQVSEAKSKTALRGDTNMFTVEMADDQCALGFTWAGNSYMNPISAILSPASNVVGTAAATIANDVDCLGLRWPRVRHRKRRCNDAVSYRVTSAHHSQTFDLFFDAWRHPSGRGHALGPQFLSAILACVFHESRAARLFSHQQLRRRCDPLLPHVSTSPPPGGGPLIFDAILA